MQMHASSYRGISRDTFRHDVGQRMCQPQEAVQTQRNQTILQRVTPAHVSFKRVNRVEDWFGFVRSAFLLAIVLC